MISTEIRFWSKVKRHSPTECWEWTGAKTKRYGRFLFMGANRRAHRVCWQLERGPIPGNLLVLHRCDNPSCVNPDHLWLGTDGDNVADMVAKGRHADNHGELNPNAKLTTGEVRLIRASPKGHSVLARHFGVTPQAIYRIRKGLTWRTD